MIKTMSDTKRNLNSKGVFIMIKQMISVFMMTLFIMSMPTIVHADYGDEVKLLASDGAYDDSLGRSISISGDTAIVGANGDDDNGISSGSAYVFVRDTAGDWTEQQKLLASDGAASDVFGESVSISGDTAIVGARGDDDNGSNSGSAYVFVRDTAGVWTEQQKLLASDGAAGDYFGRSVSISGDTVIVGAYWDDDNGTSSGSAYVFVRDTAGDWTEQQKLLASDGAASDYFGTSVSISGDIAIVGANGDDDNSSNSGSVYVFVRDTAGVWTEQKLLASDGAASDGFGGSVSISGDTAIVGASGDDYNGSAYVFVRDTVGDWTEQKLLASDGVSNDSFGVSVSISGDTTIVGAYNDDVNGINSGSAYVFVRDTAGVWTEQKLLASDGAAYDNFGQSVSVSGDTAIVGAPGGDDNNSSNSGSAYVYTNTVVTVPDITVTDSVAPINDLTVAFGDVTELAFSEQAVYVTNDGDANLTLGNINALAAPFTIETDNCSGQVLTPGAFCNIKVRFSPSSTGNFSDSFDIPSDDPNENLVTVGVYGTGVGVVSVPDITVTDSIAPVDDLQIAFGNVTQATLSNQTVTITNDGNGDLNIGNIAALDVLVAPFSILNDTCSSTTVAPTASCTLTVSFEPTSTGSFNDSFDIPSDDTDEASVTVTLSGTGVILLIPDITVTDSVLPVDDLQLTFGNVLQGTALDEAVTITNNGTADLTIGNIANANVLAVPFSILNDNCSGQTVAVAANCTLTVRFAPTAAITSNDSFDIPSDDPDENPVTLNLSGTGISTVIPAPEISVTDPLSFGYVAEGNMVDEIITITNDGTADLTIGNIAQANALDAPFSILNDNCSGQIIAAGESCTLTVRYEPVSIGTFSDSFDVPSNDADEAVVTINLSGTSDEAGNGNNGLFGLTLNPLLLLAMLMLLAISHGYRRW